MKRKRMDKLDNMIFLIDNQSMSNDWKFPLAGKIDSKYSLQTARSLFELAYRVTVHNREPKTVTIDYPNFDKCQAFDNDFVNVGYGYYSSTLDICLITFTGTYNNLLVVYDIDYPTVYLRDLNCPGCCHRGFYNLYTSVRNQINSFIDSIKSKSCQFIINGYSLGGAIATLAAFDLVTNQKCTPIVYTFASPRCLDPIASMNCDSKIRIFRIVNLADIIPTLPMPIMPKISPEVLQKHKNIIQNTRIINNDRLGTLLSRFKNEAFGSASATSYGLCLFRHVGILFTFNVSMSTYYDDHVTAYVDYLLNT